MKYRTNQGDMLDAICHKYYNGRPGATEAVLKANPRLAKVGALLPAGMVIELPDLGPAEKTHQVSLWN
ncbi:tail protein X [Photobacterium damselae]|uniref:tail protein X n=1 Tax=Photobacterium damselae TaxID=38293 RepID=UPI001EFE5999|nr:tail protein X [Photobacterium damselae]MCG9780476.1 tail protein X [Photobacterium damselae]